MQLRRTSAGVERSRGSSLIEVLVAMAILALLMVGVLQLFSLALVTDSGSAARTEMAQKAAQVAENLRYLHFLRAQGGFLPTNTGVPTTIANGTTVNLPYASAAPSPNPTTWAYWGPAGANVFEKENPPYRISYTYNTSTTPGYWFVTVSVTSAGASPGASYVGEGAKVKRVDYVCQVHI